MRALRHHGSGSLVLEEIDLPPPAPGEALVRVLACGVCGSDLHFLDGTARTGYLPITLGHEIAGTDPDGNPVVAVLEGGCGECPRCREGRPNLCRAVAVPGIEREGGLADAVALPAASLVPIPPGVTPEAAATAVDAGATAWHAVTRSAAVAPGETVLVIGVGGLGSYGVQIARLQGAGPVIAADVSPAALQLARELGADETVLMSEGASLGREVKRLTDGGVDAAVEFVGRAATVDAAVKSIRPGGRAVVAGVGTEPLVTLPPVLWSNNEYTLRGSYGSLPGDAARVLSHLADGSLRPPPVETVSLALAAEAILERSRGGGGAGRLVVVP